MLQLLLLLVVVVVVLFMLVLFFIHVIIHRARSFVRDAFVPCGTYTR